MPRRRSTETMRRTMVLDVVGLTSSLITEATPNLLSLVRRGGMRPLRTIAPAVTCSVQSTFTTGLLPRDHGVSPTVGTIATRPRWRSGGSRPTLSLVYLPHLDYDLQRYGPKDPRSRRAATEVDAACGALIEMADREGAAIIVLSEYGITEVTGVVHINRTLREAGLIAVREEATGEHLDAGASEAFAVSDHQVAHVYVRRPERVAEVRALLRATPGIDVVWGAEEKREAGLDHPRSGELVAISKADRWFSYCFWLDDARAPDYARTVDIHRKPGYDPAEIFLDPEMRWPTLQVGWTLLKRRLGFRSLLEVVSLDPSAVRGSHGRVTERDGDGPLFITSVPDALAGRGEIRATEMKQVILDHVFQDAVAPR